MLISHLRGESWFYRVTCYCLSKKLFQERNIKMLKFYNFFCKPVSYFIAYLKKIDDSEN